MQFAGRISHIAIAMAERAPTPAEMPEIPDIVRALKRRLASRYGPRLVKLCLFGSRARGDHLQDSDIDVAVVIRGLDRRGKMAVLSAVAELEFERSTAISVLVLSEEVFNELLRYERRIALDIEGDGIRV